MFGQPSTTSPGCGRPRVLWDKLYSSGVVDHLPGSERDIHNVGHIALHGVSPEEVEEMARRRHVIIPATPGGSEKRWKLFGR